jgi:hypothetical protein
VIKLFRIPTGLRFGCVEIGATFQVCADQRNLECDVIWHLSFLNESMVAALKCDGA